MAPRNTPANKTETPAPAEFSLASLTSGVQETEMDKTRRTRESAPNPMQELVKRSFDTGKALQTPPVPNDRVPQVKNAIRNAAERLNIGVTIQFNEQDNGTHTVVKFQGRAKRGYNKLS